jgi:hypothetical protein
MMKKPKKSQKAKIALDDLKVQSFVTSLTEKQMNLMGASGSICSQCVTICSALGGCC